MFTYSNKNWGREPKPGELRWRIEIVSPVASVSEKERNVFDCGWASAAPRYPATKQLIVNLPSVEVGSTITHTTVTTVAPIETESLTSAASTAAETTASTTC